MSQDIDMKGMSDYLLAGINTNKLLKEQKNTLQQIQTFKE